MFAIKLSNLDQTIKTQELDPHKYFFFFSESEKIKNMFWTIFDSDLHHHTSLLSLAIATLPSLLYFMGEPPSWMRVP